MAKELTPKQKAEAARIAALPQNKAKQRQTAKQETARITAEEALAQAKKDRAAASRKNSEAQKKLTRAAEMEAHTKDMLAQIAASNGTAPTQKPVQVSGTFADEVIADSGNFFDTGADSAHSAAEYARAWDRRMAQDRAAKARHAAAPTTAAPAVAAPVPPPAAAATPVAPPAAPAAAPRIRFVPTVPMQPHAQATPSAGAVPVTPPPVMTPPPANLLNADEFTAEQLRILDIFEQVVGDPQHGYNTLYRQHKDHRNVHAGRDFKLAARPNPHFPTDPSKALPEMTVLTVTPKGIEVHDHSMQAMASAIELSIKMYNGNFQAQNVSLEQENKILTFVLEGLANETLTDANSHVLDEVTFNNVTYTQAQARAMLAARAAGVAPPPPPPAAPSFARGSASGSRNPPPTTRAPAPPLTASRPAATGTNGPSVNAGPRPTNRFVPTPKAP